MHWGQQGATVLVALACADAVAIVASLTGSLLTMTTSVLFPAVAHCALSRRQAKVSRWCGANLIHLSVFIFGVVMAFLGTLLAVQDLVAKGS